MTIAVDLGRKATKPTKQHCHLVVPRVAIRYIVCRKVDTTKPSLVMMPHCWKSHVAAQICLDDIGTCCRNLFSFHGVYATIEGKSIFESRHEISNKVVCVTSKASDQPVHMHSMIRAFASRLSIL